MHTEIIHRIRSRGDPVFAIREKTTTYGLKLSMDNNWDTSVLILHYVMVVHLCGGFSRKQITLATTSHASSSHSPGGHLSNILA